jgi:hypothetical protein
VTCLKPSVPVIVELVPLRGCTLYVIMVGAILMLMCFDDGRINRIIPVLSERTSLSRRLYFRDGILQMATASIQADKLFVPNILWTDEYVLHLRICLKSTAVTPGHWIIHPRTWISNLLVRQLQRSGWNRWRHCCSLASATWQAFSGKCFTGAAWRCASSVRNRLWFQHDAVPPH